MNLVQSNNMKQKLNGIFLRYLKQVCSFFKFLLITFLLVSCKGQEKDNIKESESIIGKSLSNNFEQTYSKGDINYVKSAKIAKFINSSSSLFINNGGGVLDNGISFTEIVIINSESETIKNRDYVRYIFIEKNDKITDTLKVNKGLDYSSKLSLKSEYKSGIAIGKYDIEKEFFEILNINAISKTGKLIRLDNNTLVYDCPIPVDYISDEDTGNYKLGIKEGKEYSRFWNEKIGEHDLKEIGLSLKGLWSVNCENELTVLDVSDHNGYLSLFSNNAIYINVDIIDIPNIKDEYYLRFKNTDSQKNYYKDDKNVIDDEISKTENIAKLVFKGKSTLLYWYGLYNVKTKKLDFVNDFIMLKENGGKNPIELTKCD
jgi:hypothetical protein